MPEATKTREETLGQAKDRTEDASPATSGAADKTADVVELSFGDPSPAIQAWLEMNRNWANGVAGLGQEWMGLAESQARRAFDAGSRIGGCRQVDELIAIQGEIMGEAARACLDGARRMSEISNQLVWNRRVRG